VHHFKWVEGVAPRLSRRVAELQQQGAPHWVESARFVEFFEKSGGRIPRDAPQLYVGECAPAYPHWDAVKEIALRLPRPWD
jgi:hypothetical protein